MYSNRSQKVFEFLVTAFIALTMLFTVTFTVYGFFESSGGIAGSPKLTPQEAARNWASQMGLKNPKVECVAFDSNGDGYTSCTIANVLPDGQVQVIPLECAAIISIQSGCRSPKAVVRSSW